MILQPTLEGDKLRLRPLEAEDFDQLYQVASDPLIWQLHQNKDRFKKEKFREFFKDALASKGALVAIHKVKNKVMGSSRFQIEEKKESVVEIGWSFLPRAYWGGKYNGEMKRLMIGHAFRFFEHVILYIDKDNLRSQKAALKIGAKRIDGPEHADLKHEDKNNWSFLIRKDDWYESNINSKSI